MSRAPKRAQTRLIDKKPAFLAAFRASCSITVAAEAVGMDRGEHYDWLRADPAYAEAFAAAKPEAAQVLVDLAVERVKTGEFIPNVYQGRFIYPREEYEITPAIPAGDWKDEKATEAVPAVMGWRDVPGARPLGVYRRSEMLHAILLRAWVPEFKPGLELTGKDGGAIQVSLAEVLRERRAKREG